MPDLRRVAITLEIELPYEWHQQVYIGTQRYAQEAGNWRCVIDESPGGRLAKARKGAVPYDGVIARVDTALARHAKRLALPLVNTWYNSPAQGLTNVFSDDLAGARLCAEHLMDRGFKRFAFIAPARDSLYQLMMEVFRQRLAESGIDNCPAMRFVSKEVWDDAAWTRHREKLRAFIDRLEPPVGVVAFNPLCARQVIHHCHDKGWAVPQDVAVITDTPSQMVTHAPSPSITCIDTNMERVGYEAARLLDRMMDGEPAPRRPVLVPPIGIVQRDSTDYFAVDNDDVAQALRYITTNIASDLSAQRLARELHTSPSTLRRRFQEHLGRPLAAEVRRLRVALAKRLLADSDQSVKEVAHAAGFADAKRLHEVFQREVGVSPTAYRKQGHLDETTRR